MNRNPLSNGGAVPGLRPIGSAPPERICRTCRHLEGPPLTCRCLGAPIPWWQATSKDGPCPSGAPRWEPQP